MIKNIYQFIKISFKTNPVYYLCIMISSVITTLRLIFNMYQITYLINVLMTLDKISVLRVASYLVLANVLLYTLKTIIDYFKEQQALYTKEKLNHLMAQRLMSIPYHYLEDTYYLDLKERAKFANDNQNAVGQLLEQLGVVVTSIITIGSLSIILLTYDYIVLVLVGMSVILSVLVILKNLKTQMYFYHEIMSINRKYGYYVNELKNLKNAKEFRFSDMGHLMQREFKGFTQKTSEYFYAFNKKTSLYESMLGAIHYIQMGITYLYLGFKTLYRVKEVGDFTYYTQAIFNFYKALIDLINQIIGLKRLSEYVKPFIILINLEELPDRKQEVLDKVHTLEFKHVRFRYPGTDKNVLENINFKVSSNEKISIVGLNGAGKTTLVKLLARLYDVTEGEILINDININDYEITSYRKAFSTVFQDFKMFAYDIGSNISPNYKTDLLDKVLEEVELKVQIETLKFKERTNYSKEYDKNGVIFSGGEEQKLAIARALYKNSSLIILDEPTSALDPMSEAQIYENFNHMVKDKTTIYISHRMSSSTFCDKILVMNEGKVEAYLPHKELMKNKNSLYYKLFMSQAKNYKIEKEHA